MSKFTFTSESVSEGHPDKVCDYISDSILDACFAQDPQSRVACETLVKSDHVVLAGEITTNANFNYETTVRQAVKEISYTDPWVPGFDQGGHSLSSMPFETAVATPFDCVIIATDHTGFDYARIAAMPLVVDTRNALKGVGGSHIFRL